MLDRRHPVLKKPLENLQAVPDVLDALEESLRSRKHHKSKRKTLLVTAPGLGQYISGAILFEETLYQSTTDGKKMVNVLVKQNIVPGIKVDKGLVPLTGGVMR